MKVTPRFLCMAALCVALAPLSSAQQVAAQEIDCNQVVLSEGPADSAYDVCAEPSNAKPSGAVNLSAVSNAPSFGHDFQNDAFVAFASDTPQVYSLVTPYDPANFINAGDFRGNDLAMWFGLDSRGRALMVNANTGEITNLGRIDPPDEFTWTAMTWDYQDDVFYALASKCGSRTALFTVDFETRTSTQIGSANQGLLCGIALASSPDDGTLYAYGISRNELVTVSKSNGTVTPVGDLDFDPNYGQEMDFDNIDGTLYAYAYNNDTRRGELRAVDTATGNTMLIGRLGGAFPGGRNQIGAGSSRTPRNSFNLTALAGADSAPQGGTVPISYQVCNGTPVGISGELTAQLLLNGTPVSTEVEVASGTVRAQSCLATRSFNLSIPSNAPAGNYIIELNASPNGTGNEMTVNLPLVVTQAATSSSSVSEWTVTDATPWPSIDGDVSAAVTATPDQVAAFPNPFAQQTTLTFSLDEAADVRLAVYDVLGREVAVLTDGQMEAGQHTATFEARDLAVGTYIYRLVAGDVVQSGRITLVK